MFGSFFVNHFYKSRSLDFSLFPLLKIIRNKHKRLVHQMTVNFLSRRKRGWLASESLKRRVVRPLSAKRKRPKHDWLRRRVACSWTRTTRRRIFLSYNIIIYFVVWRRRRWVKSFLNLFIYNIYFLFNFIIHSFFSFYFHEIYISLLNLAIKCLSNILKIDRSFEYSR